MHEINEHNEEIERHLKTLEGYKNDLKKDPIYARYAYVTYEDLETLSKARHLKVSESCDNDEANQAS